MGVGDGVGDGVGLGVGDGVGDGVGHEVPEPEMQFEPVQTIFFKFPIFSSWKKMKINYLVQHVWSAIQLGQSVHLLQPPR